MEHVTVPPTGDGRKPNATFVKVKSFGIHAVRGTRDR